MNRPKKPTEREYHLNELRKILHKEYIPNLEEYCDELEKKIESLIQTGRILDLCCTKYEKALDKACEQLSRITECNKCFANCEDANSMMKCERNLKEWCMKDDK